MICLPYLVRTSSGDNNSTACGLVRSSSNAEELIMSDHSDHCYPYVFASGHATLHLGDVHYHGISTKQGKQDYRAEALGLRQDQVPLVDSVGSIGQACDQDAANSLPAYEYTHVIPSELD